MTPQLETYERAIIDTEIAGEDHAKAARLESTLRNGRHGVKAGVVKRIQWPKSPDGGVLLAPIVSVSAAEKAADTDPDYLAHLDAERDATFEKNMAYTRLVSARLRALGKLVDILETNPSLVKAMVAATVGLELVRDESDEREQLVGGVPK